MKKTELDSSAVLAHYAKHQSVSKASRDFDCSYGLINRILDENGVQRKKAARSGFVLTRENEDKIVALYKELGTYKAVAKEMNCGTTTVNKVIEKHGLNHWHGQKITDEQLAEECKVLTAKQIAEKYNMCIQQVGKRTRAIGVHPVYEIDRTKLVEERTNGRFEFVELISRSHYKIKCVSCGYEFTRDICSLKRRNATCPKCGTKAKETNGDESEDAKQRKLMESRKQLIKSLKRFAEYQKPKECPTCGNKFHDANPQKKYCSVDCKKRSRYKKDSCYDRIRLESQLIDTDISLRRLHKRDNGICWICGEKTDWTDWKTSDKGNKYPGDLYPVRDHVIPLARGGEHSWENVRLAHWKCNLEKSDTLYPFDPIPKDVVYSARMKSQKKRTAQYTLDGKLVRVWDCTADIKRETGLNEKRIQNVCRKDRSNTGNAFGFHWEYVN